MPVPCGIVGAFDGIHKCLGIRICWFVRIRLLDGRKGGIGSLQGERLDRNHQRPISWKIVFDDVMMIGFITGLFGVLLNFMFFKDGGPLLIAPVLQYVSFFVGYMLGVASCGILFGVITSAVNTIVV